MNKSARIYVAGHRGMVGSALVRRLLEEGYDNLVLRTSQELDLRNQQQVSDFFKNEKPEYVFMAAAKVGGIHSNNVYRAEFIYDNTIMAANVIHEAYVNNATKLMFLGSSCIYPKMAPQPLKEEYLLTGPLEYTNEPYAISKIAGLKMCEAYRDQYGCDFISAMPTNLYGPNDNYHPENSHVLPALLRKFHEAKVNNSKQVTVWGTGKVRREFLHADDLADACVFLMKNYSDKPFVNIGWGTDITINELATLIARITGFEGDIVFDHSKPDGTPRKLMDTSRLNALGWKPSITLEEGIKTVYELFQMAY
jgi:GDP-L-fucose synthase